MKVVGRGREEGGVTWICGRGEGEEICGGLKN